MFISTFWNKKTFHGGDAYVFLHISIHALKSGSVGVGTFVEETGLIKVFLCAQGQCIQSTQTSRTMHLSEDSTGPYLQQKG